MDPDRYHVPVLKKRHSMLPGGGTIDTVCERCVENWPCEHYQLQKLVAAIHEAIGEAPESDDESLPDVIAQMVKEFRERIKYLEDREPACKL